MSIKKVVIKTIANEFKNIIKNVIKVLKCDLDKEFSELRLLDSKHLKQRKYRYVYILKKSKRADAILKSYISIITIMITILAIIVPVTIQSIYNINDIMENSTNKQFDIINQQEISEEKKIHLKETLSTESLELQKDNMKSVISYLKDIIGGVSLIIVISGVIILIMEYYSSKSSYYGTVLQYIDDELIKNDEAKS